MQHGSKRWALTMGNSWRRGGALRAALAGCIALGAAGCGLEEVDSDAIRTQGIYAEIIALAGGDGTTRVRALLSVGGRNGTRVNLVADDQLVARADGVSGELSRIGSGQYEHVLSGDAAADVVVELQRGTNAVSAESVAPLPEPFAMELREASADGVPRSEAVELSWDEGGDQIQWSVEGSCIWSESGQTFDDGSQALPLAAVRVRPSRTGEECAVELTLDRVVQGQVDPAFVPGSTFEAIQRRGVVFLSTPDAEAEGVEVEVDGDAS